MNKPIEAESTPSKPIPSDKQRGIRAVELLFSAATLGGAVVVSAISGPKIPPSLGD